MGGGLMQLVAYGAQDIYLTGNPQITFFKIVYRRHTNFSMESIQQTWNGISRGANSRCTSTISRNGDLIHKMYLELSGKENASNVSVHNPTAHVIDTVEVEIGGQLIDRHPGKWLEVFAVLTEPNPTGAVGAVENADRGTGTSFQTMSGMGGFTKSAGGAVANLKYFVPLRFWFCRNPGNALPLIALQYHEVKIILNHRMLDIFQSKDTNTLWVDYIYPDTDERRRFAQVSHEYLIEQLQYSNLTISDAAGKSTTDNLNFNHPVKELVWANTTGQSVVTGTKGQIPMGHGIKYGLKLNGHDRFSARDARYFTRQQIHDYHTGYGGLPWGDKKHTDSIAVYSFALKPEEHQPSGTCNFSRIDNAQFVCTGAGGYGNNADTIFAVNYNVLRIMSGMGGLAYSN